MVRRRQVDDLRFTRDHLDEVVARMELTASRRDAWLNLRPLVDESELPRQRALSIFSAGGPVLPVGTWVPGPQKRNGVEPTSIGLAHPAASKVIPRLAEAGVHAPHDWVLRGDHPSRGVVYEAPDGSPADPALRWLVAAIEALSPIVLDGEFGASFHHR